LENRFEEENSDVRGLAPHKKNRMIDTVLSATSGTARAAAAAASAQRIRRCNTETRPWARIDIFYTDGTTRIQQAFFYKKLQAVVLENLIIVLWLIQSQSQRGTGSTTLHQGNTQGRIDIVLLHVFLEFGYRQVCYCEIRHAFLLAVMLFKHSRVVD
jgi:hypothetical protein